MIKEMDEKQEKMMREMADTLQKIQNTQEEQ